MELLSGQQRTGPQAGLKVPTIRIHVPLDQATVNINFTALAEQKYGWDALHPVAARLRALNRYESDDDSDSEAPAADPPGAKSSTGAGDAEHVTAPAETEEQSKKKRRRRKDLEYYDITDPFIDDDELVLQERTAASKDGFFVFQGPLVAEGEKVRIEKSDGTARRGGKGSRGGKGGRGRGGSGLTRTPGRPKAGPASAKTNGQDIATSSGAQAQPPAKEPVSAAAETTVEASLDNIPKTPQPSHRQKDTQGMTVEADGPSNTEEARTKTSSPLGVTKSNLPEQPTVTKEDAQPVFNVDGRSRDEQTPPGDTSHPGQSDAQQSPLKKRKLSAAVLARRTEKAAERALLKAAEKAAAKAQKHALKAAAKAEKDARKAVRASKHGSSVKTADNSAIAANLTPLSCPSTPMAPTTTENRSPASLPGSVTATPNGAEHNLPTSPQVLMNPDGTAKKPRKPPREKTAEEKAELARRARETRERKKAEKKAAMDKERAALLARAIANPNIDTSGLQSVSLQSQHISAPVGVITTGDTDKPDDSVLAPAIAITEEMNQIKQEMIARNGQPLPSDAIVSKSATDVNMPDFDRTQVSTQAIDPTSSAAGLSNIPVIARPQISQPSGTESPSGHSMNVDSLLQSSST